MEKQKRQQTFKLIAIEPLKGCAAHIRKNLKEKQKYYFYQGYEIKDDDTIRVKEDTILPPDFFSEESPNISVHAIAGKNGSGKSAIIELLMRVINNLSYIHNGSELGDQHGVVTVEGVTANLYFQTDGKYYKIHLPLLKVKKKTIVEATIKQLSKGAKEKAIKSSKKMKQIEPFFYTLLSNYSFYAYNTSDYSKELIDWSAQDKPLKRNWIDGICHKNDGYSTPIVVNPMRIKGNIDINTETHLTRSRLLTLLVNLHNKKNSLGEFKTGSNTKRKVSSICLSNLQEDTEEITRENASIPDDYKHWKYKLREYIPDKNNSTSVHFDKELFQEICSTILKEWREMYGLETKIQPDDLTFDRINENIPYNYIVAKTMTVIHKYHNIICPHTPVTYDFTKGFGLNGSERDKIRETIREQINAIIEDKSHITLKIKQALNYIKFTQDHYELHISDSGKGLSPDKFSEMVNEISQSSADKNSDTLHFMPPPFIWVEIKYDDNKSNRAYTSNFLSSGEKQWIYYTTTILYHLRNIESAFYSKENRVRYEYINIILEEIELYFHPEMQRIMVQSLLENIKSMKFEYIKGINICMITHSPIILSDIPRQNILFVENGQMKNIPEPTFGANIHSLYKHSFFMDLAMGEFAKERIQNLFERLTSKDSLSNHELSGIKTEIELVGEPLIKNQLMKLYHEKSNIEERISRLEKELEELKNKRNDD